MRGPCWHCGSDDADLDQVCPRSIRCPTCGTEAGTFCRRPSGHRADTLHAARIRLAEHGNGDVAPIYSDQEALDGIGP